MADIFLSCTGTDRQRLAPIVALLESCGWSVWWDRSIEPGEALGKVIEHELAAARCVTVAWSVDSIASPQVRSEASEGLARGILIPVLLDISTPPPELSPVRSIALAGWDGDISSPRAQELVAAVRRVLGPAADPAEPAAVPELLDEADEAQAGIAPVEDDDDAFELPRALLAYAEQGPHWERVKDSDDPNEIWAFVVAYPTGRYAEAAWERLQRLGVAPPQPPFRLGRGLALGLLIGLVAAAPAGLWLSGWIAGPQTPGLVEDAAVKVRLGTDRMPASPAPSLAIEDLLAQVTPRVEQLLAEARRLIVAGDICGARAILQTGETAGSGSLSFILAETHDPNVLSAAHKRVADPQQARAFYRKARDLGYGKARKRLAALKAPGGSPPVSQVASSACTPAETSG